MLLPIPCGPIALDEGTLISKSIDELLGVAGCNRVGLIDTLQYRATRLLGDRER